MRALSLYLSEVSPPKAVIDGNGGAFARSLGGWYWKTAIGKPPEGIHWLIISASSDFFQRIPRDRGRAFPPVRGRGGGMRAVDFHRCADYL